ncbi:hypothetical protein GQR58_002491 [Nymphon striatum]|nr:hypothetical protein GQR58_002491 [Nymphon striatum]
MMRNPMEVKIILQVAYCQEFVVFCMESSNLVHLGPVDHLQLTSSHELVYIIDYNIPRKNTEILAVTSRKTKQSNVEVMKCNRKMSFRNTISFEVSTLLFSRSKINYKSGVKKGTVQLLFWSYLTPFKCKIHPSQDNIPKAKGTSLYTSVCISPSVNSIEWSKNNSIPLELIFLLENNSA